MYVDENFAKIISEEQNVTFFFLKFICKILNLHALYQENYLDIILNLNNFKVNINKKS